MCCNKRKSVTKVNKKQLQLSRLNYQATSSAMYLTTILLLSTVSAITCHCYSSLFCFLLLLALFTQTLRHPLAALENHFNLKMYKCVQAPQSGEYWVINVQCATARTFKIRKYVWYKSASTYLLRKETKEIRYQTICF